MNQERLTQIIAQREQAMRYLGVLIERAGGETIITATELAQGRTVSREEIGFTGNVILKAEKNT